MLYLVFGHTAAEPALCTGPVPSFRLKGPQIVDHAGGVIARHNGQRWMVDRRSFYRVDCEGPVVVVVLEASQAAPRPCGPFDHFSLFNGTAYASRDVFAHYDEHDGAWHLHRSDERCATLLVTAAR